MTLNAEKGLSNGSVPPLGYKVIDKENVVNQETAPIVQEIFTKYANGISIKVICDNLNDKQLKTAKGAAFNKSSLYAMLRNRKYLGVYIFNGIEVPGEIPQIIDIDLFNKVAEKLVANKIAPGRSRAKAEFGRI